MFYNGFPSIGKFWYVLVSVSINFHKSSKSKVKFRQASNRCKRVLETAKLAYATKTKYATITSHKLGSQDFWWIANGVFNKGKSAITPLFTGLEVLSSASDKAKLFATQIISRNYLAKKCHWQSCIINFTMAKMVFALSISKSSIFPNIQLKGVVKRLPPFKYLSDHTNRFLMW